MAEPVFEIKRVCLAFVKLDDKESNVRIEMDEAAVSEYREIWERARANKEGNPFADSSEPIALFYDGDAYWVGDGRHRLKGARQADIEYINLPVTQGTKEDAILYACSRNDKHGVRLTRADKNRIVRKALILKPEWSNYALAKWCNVSEAFVRKIRDATSGIDNPDAKVKAKARKVAAPEPIKPKPAKPKVEEQTVTKAYGDELAKKLENANTIAKNATRYFSILAKCIDDFHDTFDDATGKKRHDAIISYLNYAIEEFSTWCKATLK